ncbi:MAG: sigma-70 family RNA polymerase sigma factor, partial [Clostridia bacterium]|nr:sigma-70 family RNA polymerase sigma factor [Clostridia bacterium]
YDSLAEKLILTLNENEKIIYKLKYIENKSIKEISQELNLSFDVIAKRLSRLRQKVKEQIKEQFEGGDIF